MTGEGPGTNPEHAPAVSLKLAAGLRRERRSTRNATTDSSSTTNPSKKEQ